jgi:hypothetical protein
MKIIGMPLKSMAKSLLSEDMAKLTIDHDALRKALNLLGQLHSEIKLGKLNEIFYAKS